MGASSKSFSEAANDVLVSRRATANRWACSVETVKRRQKAGLLRPIYLSKRQLRYRLSQIIAVERAAEGA